MNKDMREQIFAELCNCEGAREFEPGEQNYFLNFDHSEKDIFTGEERSYLEPLRVGVFFPSKELLNKAIKTVGEDRIKKYFFGVGAPLDKLVDKASEIVGKTLIVDGNTFFSFVLNDEEGFVYFGLNGGDFTFTFDTQWDAFRKLSSSQRKQLVEAILDYYEEVENDL